MRCGARTEGPLHHQANAVVARAVGRQWSGSGETFAAGCSLPPRALAAVALVLVERLIPEMAACSMALSAGRVLPLLCVCFPPLCPWVRAAWWRGADVGDRRAVGAAQEHVREE